MYREAKYDRGGGPKMGNVVCSGTENKIQDCQHKGSDELPSHCTLLGDRIDIAIECEHSAYTKGILYLVSINGFTYKYSYLFIFTRFHSIQHLFNCKWDRCRIIRSFCTVLMVSTQVVSTFHLRQTRLISMDIIPASLLKGEIG